MTPAETGGLPDFGRLAALLAVAAALPFVAWLMLERVAALLAHGITRLTGRRDPIVASPRGGGEGMVGLVGVVRAPFAPRGKVFVRGELWDAVIDGDEVSDPTAPEVAGSLTEGHRVQVRGLDGLTLRVAPAPTPDSPSPSPHEPCLPTSSLLSKSPEENAECPR